MGGGRARGRFQVAPAGAGAGEGDVVRHRQGEQEHVLLDSGDLRAQAGQAPLAQVDAVDGDASGAGVVGAVHQLGKGGLGGPGLAHQRHRLAGGDAQIDVGQHRLSAVVAEGDPLEGDCTAHRCLVAAGHHEPDREVGKVDQTGVDHLFDHARVVGGARHQVADALAVVKGLTLAEQAAVQFVAGVALQAVPEAGGARHHGDQRRCVAGHDAEQPKRREQQFAAAEVVDHHLRGAADHHRHQCKQ